MAVLRRHRFAPYRRGRKFILSRIHQDTHATLVRGSRTTSSGCTSFPATAAAAATAALLRYTLLPRCPIRPTKLRLLVETHTSPSARTPICPPIHGPQVDVLMAAPTSRQTFHNPSSQAWRRTG